MMHRVLRKIRFALRRPVYTVTSIARDLIRADERVIGRWTGQSPEQVWDWIQEPLSDDQFRHHLERCERRLVEACGNRPGATPTAKGIRLQYALVRAARPDLIVETGVASGVSSAHFLLALEKNGAGRLVSIDLPQERFLPKGEDPGWMVPDGLRGGWDLRLGDARELLSEVLAEVDRVDLFVHDSLHTREHMLFELRTAHPKVSPGGHLICDDVDRNDAFKTFCRETDLEDSAVLREVGFARKRS